MVYKVITLIVILPNKMKIIKQISWRRISQSEIRNSAAAESEGGAGIHFPHTPFSARPARAVWSCRAAGAALVSHSVQNRFGFGCIIAQQKIPLLRGFLIVPSRGVEPLLYNLYNHARTYFSKNF